MEANGRLRRLQAQRPCEEPHGIVSALCTGMQFFVPGANRQSAHSGRVASQSFFPGSKDFARGFRGTFLSARSCGVAMVAGVRLLTL